MKSWFAIDGALEPIRFPGESRLRFPAELANLVIGRFSQPGDWVLDPFCGFGTTNVVAQKMDRRAVGFEADAVRGKFAAGRTTLPSRVIIDDVRNIPNYDLPQFDLLFTSPPFTTLGERTPADCATYLEDMGSAFTRIAPRMKGGAKVVVELSNIRSRCGVRTVLWDVGRILSSIFRLEGELVRCNVGDEAAAPGVNHTTLLIFVAKSTG